MSAGPTPTWLDLEIEANDNCGEELLLRFLAAGPARPVARVWLDDGRGRRAFDVVGWSAGGPVPALAQPVDDSGDGVVHLVRGGPHGLRLRPAGAAAPWSLADGEQLGEPYLKIARADDLEPSAPADR